MPIHITIDDQSKEQKVDVRTAGEKRRDTITKKDPGYYSKIGSKGGKKGGRPFKDPEAARRAVNKRWSKTKNASHND